FRGCISTGGRRDYVERLAIPVRLLPSHGLSTVVDTLDGAGLIHPIRKLAGVSVTRRLGAGQVSLAVLPRRDAEVVAELFGITRRFRNQAGAYQRSQVPESIVLLTVNDLHGNHALQQLFHVAVVLRYQRIQKKSAARLLDDCLVRFVADDPGAARFD